MVTVLLDRTVITDYGQFSLEWGENMWDGDVERFFAGQQNGWVAAAVPDVAHVVLARRSGGSSVRIELSTDEPPLDDSWEDIVEVSIVIPEGAGVRWTTWGGMDGASIEIPGGSYRLRANARGRDAGRAGEFKPEVIDFYLLQLWPAPSALDSIVRVGSDNAMHWIEEWGQRRGLDYHLPLHKPDSQ